MQRLDVRSWPALQVTNVHERKLDAPPGTVGALIDTLASDKDRLWPHDAWPAMTLDRPLGAGAAGGHGPVRYAVEEYVPGESIRFRFLGPKGFDGFHGYELVHDDRSVILRHVLHMRAHGPTLASWPLVFRPLHDALIEDSLTRAEAALGLPARIQPWSSWVKLLRWFLSKGKASGQTLEKRR